jgi:anti-sigma28 factor (negative regulator of flagellin synthesis)
MRLQLDTNSLPGLNGTTGASTVSRNSGSNANQTASSGDTASLSGTASLLGKLAAERTARIANLTEVVGNGSYDVPSSAIARAIVNEALG